MARRVHKRTRMAHPVDDIEETNAMQIVELQWGSGSCTWYGWFPRATFEHEGFKEEDFALPGVTRPGN